MNKRLARLTDLFEEGSICFLGDDENGKPVTVYIQKPNSFQADESRNDGLVGRIQHVMNLDDPNNMVMVDVLHQVDSWTNDELIDVLVNQKYDEHFSNGINDVESDPDWKEKIEYLRRTPELLEDSKVAEDDPRRKQYAEANTEWTTAVNAAIQKRQEDYRNDLQGKLREDMVEQFLKDYKDKSSLEAYMTEKRITELFYAMRVCEAKRTDEPGEWDHSACDHRVKLMDSRSEVKDLPEHVITKAVETLEDVLVGPRQVANFPAAQNG